MGNNLVIDFDITKLSGAEYNPRKISEAEISTLRESVSKLGIVKPIIANGNTIVAGHQRTKALLSLGITKAPVIQLKAKVNTYDEIRFNQLHNGTDLDCGGEKVKLDLTTYNIKPNQFLYVTPNHITGNLNSQLASVRREIARLIQQYGTWGGVVATESGEVIHAAQYALACIITHKPLLTYIINSCDKDLYLSYLNKQYGKFSYGHLDKDTYIQTLAQMMRLRNGKQNKSSLYEGYVIPNLTINDRALDFGSGQGDYAKMLRSKGYKVRDIELFRRIGASNKFDLTAINKMIDIYISDITTQGQYDVVICDSVMNSVDCNEAERSILDFLNVSLKDNGLLYISGRPRSAVESFSRMTKLVAHKRVVEFLDDDGYTGIYRKGHWFYQKFHTREQFEKSLKESGFESVKFISKGTSWQCVAKKTMNISKDRALKAIDYEFNLPISKNKRIGRHVDVKNAIKGIYD